MSTVTFICEKRGTGSTLFGSKTWAERSIRLQNGKLLYAASILDLDAGKLKKSPIVLSGYKIEEVNQNDITVELHLVNPTRKSILLRVKTFEKSKWIDALVNNGAYSSSKKNVVRVLDEWDYATDEIIRSEAIIAGINLAPTRSIDDLRDLLRQKAIKAIPKPPSVTRPRAPTNDT
jgi:hypothetical protein